MVLTTDKPAFQASTSMNASLWEREGRGKEKGRQFSSDLSPHLAVFHGESHFVTSCLYFLGPSVLMVSPH